MICLQCGYCCKTMFVVIVDDPGKGIREDNLIVHEGHGPCKHLKSDNTCTIHDEPWYKQTPCFSHGQIEQSLSDECRMGAYLQRRTPTSDPH